MATTEGGTHRDAIREILAQRAGEGSDAVAATTIGIWRDIGARLAPVIGMRGVDALFGRSLYLTSKDFPWLAAPGNQGDHALQLAGLRTHLAEREPEVAVAASCALLVSFAELLTTLIGRSLADRLLSPTWAPSTQSSEQERAS